MHYDFATLTISLALAYINKKVEERLKKKNNPKEDMNKNEKEKEGETWEEAGGGSDRRKGDVSLSDSGV